MGNRAERTRTVNPNGYERRNTLSSQEEKLTEIRIAGLDRAYEFAQKPHTVETEIPEDAGMDERIRILKEAGDPRWKIAQWTVQELAYDLMRETERAKIENRLSRARARAERMNAALYLSGRAY